MAAENRRVFNALQLDAVVHVASGCGVQLADYATIGEGLNAPVSDICSFLTGTGLLDTLPLSPLKRRVMIHHPCSSRRLAGATANAAGLLQRIPGIELQTIQDTGCCGAAGSYLLLQPEMADRLRQPIVEQVRDRDGKILVTGNTGCALHLAAGLGSPGNVEVMHPVQLLARQLQ